MNTRTQEQRTTPGLVRRMVVVAAASAAVTGAAFATVATLVDQLQLEMSYDGRSGAAASAPFAPSPPRTDAPVATS